MKLRKAKKTHTADRLNMHQIQALQRINKQALDKHKFHQEKVQFMSKMIDWQKANTYEIERDRLRAAELKGPLSTEAYARKERLIQMLT